MADLIPVSSKKSTRSSPIPHGMSGGRRGKTSPLFWLLLVSLVCMLLVGIGSLGYYVLLTLQQDGSSGWENAWDSLDPDKISAGLAVWSLAGGESEQIYRQAMAGDALETATAMAVTTPSLSEAQRLGWLTVLARRHAIAGEVAKSALLYQLAGDLALLGIDLGDSQRAEALTAVASGWVDLQEPDRATKVLEQVILFAQSSPELTPPVRRQRLEAAASVFERMGEIDKARATRALPVDRPAISSPNVVDPLEFYTMPLTYTDEVIRFQNARLAQAQAFVDTWIERDGSASPSQLAALETALIDEDLVRSAYYEQILSNESLPTTLRSQILWDKIQWLAIKYRVANRLYGETLVSSWEADEPAIRQALHDAFVELSDLTTLKNQTLTPEEAPEAQFRLYASLLAWAGIGLYTDADQVFLANALNDAADQWLTAFGLYPQAIIVGNDQVDIDVRLMASPQG